MFGLCGFRAISFNGLSVDLGGHQAQNSLQGCVEEGGWYTQQHLHYAPRMTSDASFTGLR